MDGAFCSSRHGRYNHIIGDVQRELHAVESEAAHAMREVEHKALAAPQDAAKHLTDFQADTAKVGTPRVVWLFPFVYVQVTMLGIRACFGLTQRTLERWFSLFQYLIAKFHDGYRMDDSQLSAEVRVPFSRRIPMMFLVN